MNVKETYILSPWRKRDYEHYSLYYRISLNNIVRVECVQSIYYSNNDLHMRMISYDNSLIKDGYILTSQEQWDKYQLLV